VAVSKLEDSVDTLAIAQQWIGNPGRASRVFLSADSEKREMRE
jgi:hypothetical protein